MTLGVLTIATNKYLNYWKNLVQSLIETGQELSNIKLYVFTDEVGEALAFSQRLPQISIDVIAVSPMNFPEASLRRYEIYESIQDRLQEDVLMHLDADMLIRSGKFFKLEELVSSETAGVCLVAHPGYWRPSFSSRAKVYLNNPKILLSDLHMRVKLGGIGAWENNKNSLAYVPRNLRRNYVCGGLWFAKNENFKALCRRLATETQIDGKQNLVPIWHDESFLNSWCSKNSYKLLPPSYCYEPTYSHLKELENIVEAVNKNAS